MHRRERLASALVAAIVVIVAWLDAPTTLAGDALYYTEEDGALVFTNVRRQGVRPVPGFQATHRFKATHALPSTAHDRYIAHLSDTVGVSPDLIKAVAMVESGFNERARSPKGALGLMQLMPATARRYGVNNPFDPWENLRGGAELLSDLLSLYDGDLSLTLAAYNAGSGAVQRYGGIPPYRETRNYVRKVRALLEGRPPSSSGQASPKRQKPSSPVRVLRAADGTISLVN